MFLILELLQEFRRIILYLVLLKNMIIGLVPGLSRRVVHVPSSRACLAWVQLVVKRDSDMISHLQVSHVYLPQLTLNFHYNLLDHHLHNHLPCQELQ